MTSCNLLEIVTPKNVILKALLFGPTTPKTIVIFLHGLGSSLFAHHDILLPLVTSTTSVLSFNNRGHDEVADIKKLDKRKARGKIRIPGGAAREIFTDCIDDIQGAVNTAKQLGADRIFLLGQSTGCQKVSYYLSKRQNQKHISGAILLAPISDYASRKKVGHPIAFEKALQIAQTFVDSGKPHALLPEKIWPELSEAQRFISLYTPDSPEEIFSYAQSTKNPKALRNITNPLLVVLGEKDQYRDRPIKKIADWFSRNTKQGQVVMIPQADHGFSEHTQDVINLIQEFIAS
jgi:pimeloyl-ACP methyl ester carboxylesterase